MIIRKYFYNGYDSLVIPKVVLDIPVTTAKMMTS